MPERPYEIPIWNLRLRHRVAEETLPAGQKFAQELHMAYSGTYRVDVRVVPTAEPVGATGDIRELDREISIEEAGRATAMKDARSRDVAPATFEVGPPTCSKFDVGIGFTLQRWYKRGANGPQAHEVGQELPHDALSLRLHCPDAQA